MRRKKQREEKTQNKGLKVIISLYKGSREISVEMQPTIIGTTLKTDRRNRCKEQNQFYK